MKKSKKIKLHTYNCCISFIVTDQLNAVINEIYKKFKSNELFTAEAEGVVVTFDIDNYHIVLDAKYLTYNTISHELYHAVVRITEDRDIVDEESQAWLMGYLAQEMYRFISKNSLKIIK